MSEETVVADTPPVETQAPVDVTTKIETPAETPEAEVKAEEAAPADKPETQDEPTDEPKKKPSGIDRLKRRAALLQADADALARENEELRRRSTASDPQGKPGIDRAPTEQDFPSDYLAFERANNAWQVRQAVRDEISKVESKGRESQLREIRQERFEAYEENVSEVRERIPDFDKTLASANGVQVSPALIEEIMSSDKAALLQYHLAKNPDKVRELNSLSGRELAREIGRLEMRVHLPTPKKATEAASPPSQVRGSAATAVDPQTGPDDMNAYVKWREKRDAKAS